MSAAEHERAADLLPWLVNGSLQGSELTWLNHHLADCAQCREELYRQRLVRDAVARQPVVELAPQASFNRLWARIEAQAEAPADALTEPLPRPGARSAGRYWGRVAGLAGGAAAALALVSLMLWQDRAPGTGDRYHTVSSAAPAVLPGQIRVVFTDTATVADIKDILANARLEATAGPTPAGVFTLHAAAEHADGDLGAVVQALRADPRVRFAELR
jgi:hypothetical protein